MVEENQHEDDWLERARCSICGEPQFDSPSGLTCINGHGGAPTESESESEPTIGKAARGEVVTKSAISKWTGLAPVTIDKTIAEGAPVISKGARKTGWQINSAEWFSWWWRRKVAEATGDPDALGMTAAARQDKEWSAKTRELNFAMKVRDLIPVSEVVSFMSEKFGVIRSRFLMVESQVHGLSDEQRQQLKTAIIDALADISGDKKSDWTGNGLDDLEDEQYDFG